MSRRAPGGPIERARALLDDADTAGPSRSTRAVVRRWLAAELLTDEFEEAERLGPYERRARDLMRQVSALCQLAQARAVQRDSAFKAHRARVLRPVENPNPTSDRTTTDTPDDAGPAGMEDD